MFHMIGRQCDGYGPDGRRRYFKGGGGDAVKYDSLEALYEEQANSARLLREQAEANLPGAVNAYVGEVQDVLAPDYAERRANLAGADMAGANAKERAATERSLSSMGVNPNDPRFAGSMRATEVNNAARLAAGKNLTRNEADTFQLNVAKDAVGTFTGQSNNAATQMGNAATGLGSIYASQANQQMAQQQAQSQAAGNAVAGGMAAWSMLKNGGKVRGIGLKRIERHMLGGTAGGQQNQGFFQMQSIAPPPTAQAPQQQSSMLNPTSMASMMKTGKDFKAAGGFQGAAARNTDKIGKIAGVFDEQAGNSIQSYSRGMTMSPDQAKAASDAYVEAAKTAADPATAEAYMNTASNIQAGAGGELAAAAPGAAEPVSAAAMTGLQEAGLVTQAGTVAEGVGAGTAVATGTATTGAGTGAAAGLSSALGAAGAALPWLGAAYAVGSMLEWWNKGGKAGTQQCGMTEDKARQAFSDAFNAGEVNDIRAGGTVPGEWRENVDTVPALLVEGEGVLNAEAMALGGERVMEDLNAKGLALRKQGITPTDIKRGVGLRGLKRSAA